MGIEIAEFPEVSKEKRTKEKVNRKDIYPYVFVVIRINQECNDDLVHVDLYRCGISVLILYLRT